MHNWLAEMYGTGEDIGSSPEQNDVEKLAQAEILDQMFEAEDVDWNALDADTVEKVAEELFGAENQITAEELTKAASDEDEGETEPDAQEKFAEADFAGRVMAHSFNQELDAIELEKEALSVKGIGTKARQAAKAVGEWTGATPGLEAHRLASKASKEHGRLTQGIKTLKSKGDKATASTRSLARSARGSKSDQKAYEGLRGEYAKRFGARVAAPVAGVAAVGAAGKAIHSAVTSDGKKKKAALDTLAENRAMEILEQNGYTFDDDGGQNKLAEAVEMRAYEMLSNAGYIEGE